MRPELSSKATSGSRWCPFKGRLWCWQDCCSGETRLSLACLRLGPLPLQGGEEEMFTPRSLHLFCLKLKMDKTQLMQL